MGAGMINAVTTNPIWVIKTRLQTQTMKGKERRYMSIAHSFSVIYQEEGIKGFYKGPLRRVLPSRVSPDALNATQVFCRRWLESLTFAYSFQPTST